MLYALRDPLQLVLLVVAFVVAATLSGWLSALAVVRLGLREPGRGRPDPRRQLDPYGAIGAAVAGVGWPRPVELPEHRRGAGPALAVLTGPLVLLVAGVGALVAYALTSGPVPVTAQALQQGLSGAPLGDAAWVLGGLMAAYVGALGVVPLPPLPGGYALFALAPRTTGWQKARYQLVERNIGVAVLLALLLVPLGGPQALLPTLLDTVLAPLVRVAAGG